MAEKKKNSWIVWTIIGVVVASIVGGVIYARSWWSDIKFKPDLTSIKNNLLSIAASLLTNQKFPITVLVDNPNKIGVTVRDFSIKGSYQGTQVFQTTPIPVLEIPAETLNHPITGEIELFANLKTVQLANQIAQNTKPVINLTITLTKFGVTKSFNVDYPVTF